MTSALTRVRYGRYRTSADSSYTTISAGTLRLTHHGEPTVAIWVDKVGAWMGRQTSTPNVIIGIFEAGVPSAGTTPSTLVAQSTTVNPSTDMLSASGGAQYEPALSGGAYALITPGKIYAIGPLTLGYDLGVGSLLGGTYSTGNTTLYNKSGLSALPDPFSPSSSSSGYGRLATWASGYQNEIPLAPGSLSPSGTVYSLTPTFTGTFLDLNGAYGTTTGTGLDQGDVLNQIRIQVREVGGTTLFWNTTLTATGAEQTADAFSRTYAGTTLVRGTDYEWRTQVSDQAGSWSDWTDWEEFTPADAGVITLDGDPTGKLEVVTGIDFDGKWTHATSLVMEEVKVRVYSSGGTLLQQSGTISKAAASSASPGTAFTVTWAETGFDDLAWGQTYYFAMSGKDSDDNWTNYYASSEFTTNAAPTVPTSLSPSNSAVYTSPPLLSASWTDSDDTTSTGLTGTFIGTSADGGSFSVTPTYNSSTSKWEYQLVEATHLTFDEVQNVLITSTSAPTGGTFTLTYSGQTTGTIAYNASAATVQTALEALSNLAPGDVTVTGSARDFDVTFGGTLADTDVSLITIAVAGLTGGSGHADASSTTVEGGIHYATWTWQARSYDGTVYSGEATSSGDATLSSAATFIYANGPTVTFVEPDDEDTITAGSMTVEWTTTDQQKYRVWLYEDGTTTEVYDSGEITSTTSSHVIPYGSYSNDEDYDLTVWVQDSLLLEGTNTVDIDVSYTAPDSLTNVQVSAVYADSADPVETAIMVSHDPTEYPLVDTGDGGFVGYMYYRSADGGPDADRVLIAGPVTSPSNTTFIDYHPASGYEYTYEAQQVVLIGSDQLESDAVTGTAELTLGQNHVLTMLGNGGTYRAVLTNVREKAATPPLTNDAVYQSLGSAKPVTISGAQYAEVRTYEAAIIADDYATAEGRLAAFRELCEQKNTVVICDGAGEKLYGRIVDPAWTAEIGDVSGRWYTVTFGIREEDASEGTAS